MTAVVRARPPRELVHPRPDRRAGTLRVAPARARRRRRVRLAVLGTSLITALSLFALVAFHSLAVQSAFTLDRLAKERTNEQLRYERLREQVASLSAPPAVVAAATDLGMVRAPTIGWVQAPAAAPTPVADPAQETLATTWLDAKRHLDEQP